MNDNDLNKFISDMKNKWSGHPDMTLAIANIIKEYNYRTGLNQSEDIKCIKKALAILSPSEKDLANPTLRDLYEKYKTMEAFINGHKKKTDE